jgi:hypothetical protein
MANDIKKTVNKKRIFYFKIWSYRKRFGCCSTRWKLTYGEDIWNGFTSGYIGRSLLFNIGDGMWGDDQNVYITNVLIQCLTSFI